MSDETTFEVFAAAVLARAVAVVEIGCLECGEQSRLLGVYWDMAAARTAHPDAIDSALIGEQFEHYDPPRPHTWTGSGLIVAFRPVEEGSSQQKGPNE